MRNERIYTSESIKNYENNAHKIDGLRNDGMRCARKHNLARCSGTPNGIGSQMWRQKVPHELQLHARDRVSFFCSAFHMILLIFAVLRFVLCCSILVRTIFHERRTNHLFNKCNAKISLQLHLMCNYNYMRARMCAECADKMQFASKKE